MILQIDGRLKPEIHKHGCYLLCLLYFANKFTNMEVDPASVNDGMWKLFTRREWMNEQAYILNPEAILNWCGVNCTYTNTHETPDRICDDREFEILYWRHPETGGHFTAGNGKGIVTYDPWGVSKAATEGALMSKRIFRRAL